MIRTLRIGIIRILRVILLNRLKALGIATSTFTLLFFYVCKKEDTFMRMNRSSRSESHPPAVDFVCTRGDPVQNHFSDAFPDFERIGNEYMNSYPTENKVLLLVESESTQLGMQICSTLDSLRITYKTQTLTKNLPSLNSGATGKGLYALIIIENLYKYLNLDNWDRVTLDRYCRQFNVSILAFMPSRSDYKFDRAKVKGFPLYVRQNLIVRKVAFSSENVSYFYHVTRPGHIQDQNNSNGLISSWNQKANLVGFEPRHETYRSILNIRISVNNRSAHEATLSACLLDSGQFDGVRRLFFGNDFASFWLLKLLFIDGLRYLSHGLFSLPLIRYLQIDIDDVFVGDKGKKMTPEDVEELVAAQNRLKLLVENFTFNLGFSRKFFGRGGWIQQQGDSKLIEVSKRFWWFSHSWGHSQAHNKNFSDLVEDMSKNELFSKEHGIPVQWAYSVAPHHSGVYPVHGPLYQAWKSVWNITVTSTEQYPHLKRSEKRRGFIHNGIRVLPRQTCGLYTHTTLLENYPGGKSKLDQSIKGGELFYTLILNEFLIFMTHQTNYAHDRLSLYTFEKATKFVHCWTNLKFVTIPPSVMANKYFEKYPEEKEPVWGNPCSDKRHSAIWSPEKSCDRLPKVLIIGPQKTGTTALHRFLKLHPRIRSNIDNNQTFEEIQFFSGRNYKRGIDWYMNQFELNPGEKDVLLFEKSATYFADGMAPYRVHALIPDVRLICILINPINRTYSWYQHMKFHNDEAANKYDFMTVLNSSEQNDKLLALKNRCLQPGHYAEHIERWLDYFATKQLLIIDGEIFKVDPVDTMNVVQKYLKLHPVLNYTSRLRFSAKKGFYCVLSPKNRTMCLGRSKGRSYEPMTAEAEKWLSRYYRSHNVALYKLLIRLRQPIPQWLVEQLKKMTTSYLNT